MSNGSSELAYQLFRNAPRTQNWGQVLASDRVASFGLGMAINRNHQIYGRIPDSGINLVATPGNYTDTVLVTISY
jgi:spore coat protein U-like protein